MFNCTQIDVLLEKHYLVPLYSLEFSFGFPGNLIVILAYVFCLPEWQSTNVYLFNLAVSDLIFLSTLPHISYLYANSQYETNPYLCIINRYILHVNLYSSILFMAWVSMDRFLLIRYPTREHFLLKTRTANVVAGMSWLVVNIQVCPMIALMVDDIQRSNMSLCQDFASLRGDFNLSYSLALTFTGYVLPLLGLCLFSQWICQLLHAQDGALPHRINSYRGPLKVVRAAAAMFFCIYTPYHVMRNVRLWSQQPSAGVEICSRMYIEGAYIMTRPIAFSHSVINPVFYFFMGDKFRELLLTKFRKVISRDGM